MKDNAVKKALDGLKDEEKALKYFYQINVNTTKVDHRIVLIESFHGQNISDSGLEIAREILRSYPNTYRIYFASENVPAHTEVIRKLGLDVELVSVFSFKYTRILAKAGYIFANTGLPIFFIKRPGQKYLQTWHGTPLKTLGKKMRMGIASIYLAQHGFLQADYLLQPNEFTKDVIMKDYNLEKVYTGKVVMAGYPRNKIFTDPEAGKKLKEELGLKDKTVYAYMPTWRGQSVGAKNTVEYAATVKKIFKKLDKKLLDHQVFYVNFHPILRGSVKLDDYKHIKQFPDNVDTYSFLNCADALVTDYSSVFFDFSLTEKPIILFIYDYDEYMRDRGMNMDIRTLPFRLVHTTDELAKCLTDESCLNDTYTDTPYFQEFFKYDAPDVTERLVRMVLKGTDEGFEIIDYSENKKKELTVYKPRILADTTDFLTLKNVAGGENAAVWLDKKKLKKQASLILHDEYNDDFDYIVADRNYGRTFMEEIGKRLLLNRTVEKLNKRNIERIFPGFDKLPTVLEDYGCFETGCIVALSDTVPAAPMDVIKNENGDDFSVVFKDACGLELKEAVILNRQRAILKRRDLQEEEKKDLRVSYNIRSLMEDLTLFRSEYVFLGVIGKDTEGKDKLILFADEKKDQGGNYQDLGERILFRPFAITADLPRDYENANLKRIKTHRDENIRARLANYDMTPVPTEVICVPRIRERGQFLEVAVNTPQRISREIYPGGIVKTIRESNNVCTVRSFFPEWHKDYVSDVRLIYRSRSEDISIPLNYEVKETGKGVMITAKIEANENMPLCEGRWDIRVITNVFDQKFNIRMRYPSRLLYNSLSLKSVQVRIGNYILFPYFGKGDIVNFMYRPVTKHDTPDVRRKELAALAVYYIAGSYYRKKKLRIIYEKFSNTAQDNSYYFFKYCMEQLPEEEKKNIFYVIDPSSPDYPNVEKYKDHVLPFMSIKHMVYAMTMHVAISTDAVKHLYAWETKPSYVYQIIRRNRNILFLQHGVTALKKVHKYFGRLTGSSPMMYFVCTSKTEQEIVINELGYSFDNSPVTGFARWDALEDKSDPNDPFILMMPTWRSWLEEVEDDKFETSEYFTSYMSFLTDPRLEELVKKHNMRMVLYVHPKFAKYTNSFAQNVSANIEYIPFGKEQLNELMMKCSMFITDYSSTCWDVLYMNKPVVFYQFDYDRYMLEHGSYINMKTDLPGDRAETKEEALRYIEETLDNGMKIKPEYEEMLPRYYAYRDHENCKRIFEYLKNTGN